MVWNVRQKKPKAYLELHLVQRIRNNIECSWRNVVSSRKTVAKKEKQKQPIECLIACACEENEWNYSLDGNGNSKGKEWRCRKSSKYFEKKENPGRTVYKDQSGKKSQMRRAILSDTESKWNIKSWNRMTIKQEQSKAKQSRFFSSSIISLSLSVCMNRMSKWTKGLNDGCKVRATDKPMHIHMRGTECKCHRYTYFNARSVLHFGWKWHYVENAHASKRSRLLTRSTQFLWRQPSHGPQKWTNRTKQNQPRERHIEITTTTKNIYAKNKSK